MLHHLSITAQEPRKVAEVLAELTGGDIGQFAPNAGSWYVKTHEEGNIHVEIYPLGTEMRPNPKAAEDPMEVPEFHVTDGASRYSGTHVAISVGLNEDEILDIARRAGWEATSGNRGPFRLVDVWVENRLLFEVLTPEMEAEYLDAPPPGPLEKRAKN